MIMKGKLMAYRIAYLKNVVTLKLEPKLCIGCGMCENVCPHSVFIMTENPVNYRMQAMIDNRDACMECGACSKNCPTGALTVKPGVRCASAIIKGMINGTEPSCDCDNC